MLYDGVSVQIYDQISDQIYAHVTMMGMKELWVVTHPCATTTLGHSLCNDIAQAQVLCHPSPCKNPSLNRRARLGFIARFAPVLRAVLNDKRHDQLIQL